MIRARGHSPPLPPPAHAPHPSAPLAAPQQAPPMGNTSQDQHPALGHIPVTVPLCAHCQPLTSPPVASPTHRLALLGPPAWL